MRQFILAGLVALCLTTWSASAQGADMMIPLQPVVWHQEEQPSSAMPAMDKGGWLWDLMLHRLTFPLAPDNQNIYPLGTKGEQWIGVVANQWRVVETQVPVGLPAEKRS